MILKYLGMIVAVVLLYKILKTFKRLKLNFFTFVVGIIGVFTISMVFFLEPLNIYINLVITKILQLIAQTIGGFQVYISNSIVLFECENGVISMLLNYECSGIIEMMVFSSLVLFFPFIKKMKKISTLIIGNLYIIACNIVRILSIIIIVKLKGIAYYDLAHGLIARVIFFILIIILYYRVFTRNQIKNQKIGDIV